MTSESNLAKVQLTGLNGSNPLAFLAAIGTFNVVNRQQDTSLSWSMSGGTWFPNLHGPHKIVDSLVAVLDNLLATELGEPWKLSKKLPFDSNLFRDAMMPCILDSRHSDRTKIDTFAAYGSEVFCDDKGQFQDTAFRMVRSGDSAGQGLPDYACKLAHSCEAKDIEGALFGPWTYAKGLSSFRWDPSENKEYALQSVNPSNDGSQTAIGVNRLALEALTLYPTMPGRRGLETVGFVKSSRGKEAEFRWPIWEDPLGVDTVRSLLTCPLLFANTTVTEHLREVGIACVFCSRQIKPNQYYRNFSPSYQV